MKKTIIILTLVLFFINLAAQNPKDDKPVNPDFQNVDNPILHPNIRMQTEVFVLDTKDPSQLSLVRMYDDNKTIKLAKIRKLSVDVNKFSAFKIININPLRYNYFINNELVTNFFDVASDASKALSFGNGLPENIDILPIYNSTKNNTANPSNNYNEIKTRLKSISDKKSEANNNYTAAFFQQTGFEGWDTVNKRIIYNGHGSLGDYNKAKKEVDLARKTLDSINLIQGNITSEALNALNTQNLKSYQTLTSLNNSLQNFSSGLSSDLTDVNSQIKTAIVSVVKENQNMDELLDLGFKILKSYRGYNSYGSNIVNADIDKFQLLLSEMHYRSAVDFSNGQNIRDEILNVNEFILSKKAKELEDFYLNTYLSLGNILQKKYFEYSRKINEYSGKNYISDNEINNEVNNERNELKEIFSFFQILNNSLYIIQRSLDVSDISFRDLEKDIKDNYTKLLVYLKKLDYISNNNTVEYSLPTHNNLKNIDLIRYKIDRTDKTNSSINSQTYIYDIWLRGGLKIDFSVGIMGTGLVDLDFSKVQHYKDDGTTLDPDYFSLTVKDKGAFNFAFGGMVNIYRRNGGNWLNWGGSVGVVYSTNQKLQFLVGPTIHCGKTERIILHGGVAMGFRQTLDESQLTIKEKDKDKKYLIKGDYGTFAIPLIDKFSVKPFIGISYNLSKKNALQAVSSQPGLKMYNDELNPQTP